MYTVRSIHTIALQWVCGWHTLRVRPTLLVLAVVNASMYAGTYILTKHGEHGVTTKRGVNEKSHNLCTQCV